MKAYQQRVLTNEDRGKEINNAVQSKLWRCKKTRKYPHGYFDADYYILLAMGFIETLVMIEPSLTRYSIIERGDMEQLINPPTIKELEYVLRRTIGNLSNG
jgi:hypothetical protein